MSTFEGFPADTFRFLEELQENNNRPWFAANKERYESSLLQPALQLIRCLERPLHKAAPLLKVEAKKVGGSLMRIYKDTRFSKDKTPYKTNIGIHFRHQAGKDVHAPGVYLHIANDECFLGVGIWRPPTEALKAIRDFISHNSTAWRKIAKNKKFSANFGLYDDRLKSVPRGFDKEDPMIDDLRLKSFIGMAPLTRDQLQSTDIVATITNLVKSGKPLMLALGEALGQPY